MEPEVGLAARVNNSPTRLVIGHPSSRADAGFLRLGPRKRSGAEKESGGAQQGKWFRSDPIPRVKTDSLWCKTSL